MYVLPRLSTSGHTGNVRFVVHQGVGFVHDDMRSVDLGAADKCLRYVVRPWFGDDDGDVLKVEMVLRGLVKLGRSGNEQIL